MPTEWTAASLQAHLLAQLPGNRIKCPTEETKSCACADCVAECKQWAAQEAYDKKIGKEIAEKLAVQKSLDKKKAEIEAKKASIALKKAALELKKKQQADQLKALANAVAKPLVNPAGNKQKYGGTSPYTDKDVEHAQDYLTEMGFDPHYDVPFLKENGGTRMAAHMIAEFAGHRNRTLNEENLKLKQAEGGMNGTKVQITALQNKVNTQQSRIHTLQAQVEAMKKQGITIPLPGEFVAVETCRKLKDI